MYNAVVVPMMMHGCESWVLREKEKAKLQTTEMSILRKVAGVTRLDCIRNNEVRQRLQQRSIVEVVKERRLNWRAKLREKAGKFGWESIGRRGGRKKTSEET